MDLQDTQGSVSTSYGDVELPTSSGETPSTPEAAPSTPGQGEAQPQAPWWQQHENSEMEFTARGKQIKAPLSKVRQWAQQGYDYGQRMEQFNKERSDFESKLAEFSKDSEISEIVKFARENPEWNEYVRNQWQNRETWRQQNADNPLVDEFNRFKQEIAPLKQEVEAFRSERQRVQQEQQDTALETEVKTVADRYSKYGMDLAAIDPETGMSYEYEALKYGSENGIKSFRTAFLERYGDQLEAMRDEAIKKQAAEELAKRQKEGFIGRSSTPTQAPSKAQNVAKRSYSSLSEEALRDIQAGKY